MSDSRASSENSEPPPRYDSADASIPRASVMKEFEGDPGPCPHCGGRLSQHTHTYMVATRHGHGDELGDSFILGGDFGWFCLDCPAVVLDSRGVEKLLLTGRFRWDVGDHYVVAGLVDLKAIPESKRNVPLGEDDNPIPLVRFTNLGQSRSRPSRRSRASKKTKAKRKQQKKARRRSRR